MPTQLETLASENAGQITIDKRVFTLEGIAGEQDEAIATLLGPRAKYTAVLCPKVRVIGRPGAETWAVLSSSGRTVIDFVIHEGKALKAHKAK